MTGWFRVDSFNGAEKKSGVCMGEGSPWAHAGVAPRHLGLPRRGVRVAALCSPTRTGRAISGRVPSTLPKSTPFLGDRSQERGAPGSDQNGSCVHSISRAHPLKGS
jgi:hypothetical protein